MVREIKFKVWDNKAKEFVANGEIMDLHYSMKCNAFMFDNDNYDLDKSHIALQFINSKDRNGIEVFDGDILEAPSGNLFVVKWYEEEMRWAMWSKDTWYNINMALHSVVGNIYENAELLHGVS